MKYFIPDIRLSEELPPQQAFEEKLGGIPWGIKPVLWPHCSDCGKSQSLLAQFVHHPKRLDLGRDGRILRVFQCNHEPGTCPTWEGGSGTNACFVSEPESLIEGPSPLPQDGPPVEREVRIVRWIERDDNIPEERIADFFDAEKFFQLTDTLHENVSDGTKLGSVPYWFQSPEEAPTGAWRFIGQLDSNYSFLIAPRVKDLAIFSDPEAWEGHSHFCEGPNFGGGVAYLFLSNHPSVPEGWFFWQC